MPANRPKYTLAQKLEMALPCHLEAPYTTQIYPMLSLYQGIDMGLTERYALSRMSSIFEESSMRMVRRSDVRFGLGLAVGENEQAVTAAMVEEVMTHWGSAPRNPLSRCITFVVDDPVAVGTQLPVFWEAEIRARYPHMFTLHMDSCREWADFCAWPVKRADYRQLYQMGLETEAPFDTAVGSFSERFAAVWACSPSQMHVRMTEQGRTTKFKRKMGAHTYLLYPHVWIRRCFPDGSYFEATEPLEKFKRNQFNPPEWAWGAPERPEMPPYEPKTHKTANAPARVPRLPM